MRLRKKILILGAHGGHLGIEAQNLLEPYHYDVCFVNYSNNPVEKITKNEPDLILYEMGLDFDKAFGVYELIDKTRAIDKIPFVFLSESSDLVHIRRAMLLGADDYLVKPYGNFELIAVIEKRIAKYDAIKRNTVIEPTSSDTEMRETGKTVVGEQLVNNKVIKSIFTNREIQILYLSMEGLAIKSIADRLSVSSRTIEKYRSSLMRKAKAGNMIEVIVFALKNGLVDI